MTIGFLYIAIALIVYTFLYCQVFKKTHYEAYEIRYARRRFSLFCAIAWPITVPFLLLLKVLNYFGFVLTNWEVPAIFHNRK